jgi:uridine kinase
MSHPLVVGICGGTGSGKTTITRRIIEALSEANAAVLEQDNYYRDHPYLSEESRANLSFDHPDSVDMPLLIEHVRMLCSGQTIERPTYSFAVHRVLAETVRIEPRPVLVVEGILILQNEVLRGLMDIKVFVEADPDLRFIRRLERDVNERGRTIDSVIKQYMATVRLMHTQFVEPSKSHADMIISGVKDNRGEIEALIQKVRSLMRKQGKP